MEYYSCGALQSFQLVFNGNLDNEKLMACCCEPLNNIPGCSVKELKAGEVLDSFIKMREDRWNKQLYSSCRYDIR